MIVDDIQQAEIPGFTILGVKISYAKAFGVAFLVIFLLLFFPGIGISSSGKEDIAVPAEEPVK